MRMNQTVITASGMDNCSHGRLVKICEKGKKNSLNHSYIQIHPTWKPAFLWKHQGIEPESDIFVCVGHFKAAHLNSNENSSVYCAEVRDRVKQILSWWTISLHESLSWIVMEIQALGLVRDTFISISSIMEGRLWKMISWDSRFHHCW